MIDMPHIGSYCIFPILQLITLTAVPVFRYPSPTDSGVEDSDCTAKMEDAGSMTPQSAGSLAAVGNPVTPMLHTRKSPPGRGYRSLLKLHVYVMSGVTRRGCTQNLLLNVAHAVIDGPLA